MRTTMKDVANRAGVSTATVSRVLSSGPSVPNVTPSTRARVLRVCRELRFHTNPVARALRRRRTGLVAVIVRDLADPFNSLVLKGIDQAIGRSAFGFHIDPVAVGSRMDLYEEIYRSHVSDGMIVVGDLLDNERLDRHLLELCPKTVLVSHPRVGGIPTVVGDEKATVGLALEFLCELGHRAIAFGYNPEVWSMRERHKAFLTSASRLGIDIRPLWIVEAEGTPGGGGFVMRRLLEDPKGPTAVIYGNDAMALGGMNVAWSRGLTIPDELSVCGIGNTAFSGFFSPSLTTVNQNYQLLGELAATMLVDWLENRARPPSDPQVVPAELMARESTAAPRHGELQLGDGGRC